MLPQNKAEFDKCNITTWQQDNQGELCTIAVIDEGDMVFDQESIIIPITQSISSIGHGAPVIAVGREIAQKAKVILLAFEGNNKKQECIDYIKNHAEEIDIINISYTTSSVTAKKYFDQLKDLDIPIICSSGNDGEYTVDPPASFDYTISVGAWTEVFDKRDRISNYGENLDCVAPSYIYYLNSRGETTFFNGTSCAASVVSFAVSLYITWQKKNGLPRLGREAIRQMIHDNAIGYAPSIEYGHGLFSLPEELPVEKQIKEGDDMLPYSDISKLRVTNPYGVKNSAYSAGYHTGIDFVSDGDKNIFAIQSGKVIRSTLYGAWGNFIVIQQEDGLSCVYAHLSKRYVNVGDNVAKGDLIGVEGSTGNSTGSHLHIELLKTYYDPLSSIDIAEYLGIKNVVGPAEEVKTVEVITMDTYSEVENQRIDVPLRAIMQAFGANVKYTKLSEPIVIELNGIRVTHLIGTNQLIKERI